MDWGEFRTPEGERYFVNAKAPGQATRMIYKTSRGWECSAIRGMRRNGDLKARRIGYTADPDQATDWLEGKDVPLYR